MKKTLLVTIDYPPAIGGVATYLEQVASSFSKDELIVLTIPSDKAKEDDQVVRKSLLFSFFWPKWIKGIWQIWRVYKQTNCEQVLVGQVLPVGSMVMVLNKLFSLPYIVQVYGMDLLQAKQSSRKNALAKSVLHNAQSIITNSEAVKKIVNEFIEISRPVSVVFPVPKNLPRPKPDIEKVLLKKYDLKDKKIILTVGRLVARKGQDKTLGAMVHIWQKHPDAVYVIVGNGEEKDRLKNMAIPHKNQVIFVEHASNEERDAWLGIADIFIMPSRQTSSDIEGYGIVYLEANAMGVPVIGGNQGGAIEAIIHEKTGLLVDPEDIDEIAKALLRLIEHPDFAKELGENGQNRLKTELSWDSQVEMLKKILKL